MSIMRAYILFFSTKTPKGVLGSRMALFFPRTVLEWQDLSQQDHSTLLNDTLITINTLFTELRYQVFKVTFYSIFLLRILYILLIFRVQINTRKWVTLWILIPDVTQGRILLNDIATQDTFLNNIVAIARQYGFLDIHCDFEYLRPVDKEAYNRFLRKVPKVTNSCRTVPDFRKNLFL